MFLYELPAIWKKKKKEKRKWYINAIRVTSLHYHYVDKVKGYSGDVDDKIMFSMVRRYLLDHAPPRKREPGYETGLYRDSTPCD